MKKITRIIPVLCMLITTVLSIIFLDFNDSSKYLQFKNYDKDFISLNYTSDVTIDEKLLTNILKLAQENNVILAKSNISSDNVDVKDVYLSFNSITKLNDFIKKEFKVKKLNNKNLSNNDDMFISTYNHNNKNQIGLIPDLLENSYYNYYTFDKLLLDNGNFYGEYIVYYNNYEDFSEFSNQVKMIIGQSVGSNSTFTVSQNYMFIFIIICIVILMMFYFVFQVYDSYYKSKHIGCMKLLGFEIKKITNIICRQRIKLYIFVAFIILLLSMIFVKNLNIIHIFSLLLINTILILLTYFINYLCIKIILGRYQTSNILNKQNIALKISKTSGNLKVITICILVIAISLLFQSMVSLFSNLKVYNNSKELLDYGIIKDFNADAPEIFDYDKQMDLYSYIIRDKNLSTFYSQFSSFTENTAEEQEFLEQSEIDGTYFEWASVDVNYLKKEKIKIYDLNNNIIDVDSIDGVFFLFPKNKRNKIEQFNVFYKEDSKKDYDKYNINHNFVAYLYDDQKLNSYRLDLNIKYVDSPIVRVIDDSIRLSYLESSRGLSVLGNSLTTGLKIQIVNNKNETFNMIENHIKEAKLDNLIKRSNFMSFHDYFNDEIKIARFISFAIALSFTIVLCVYIIISIQVISLYVKSENQKVIVKYLLGFDKNNIFSPIINKNIKYNIISFTLTLLFLFIINSLNVLLFLISISVFLIIDYIILFLIIKTHDFSKVYMQLKGGNYD